MKTHGLMGNNNEGYHDWVSRDYRHVDCDAIGCLYNAGSACMVPSVHKVSADGRCEGFVTKPLPKIIDGD